MVPVYAVALIAGIVALVGWIFAHAIAANVERARLDPERRFGVAGRRAVAGLCGFGLGGMSASYASHRLSTPLALVLALAAAAAAAWYAGRVEAGPD